MRQVQRLLRLFTTGGPAALASARRSRPANNRLPEDFRCLVLDIIRQHYADFGPKLATEKLAERHGLRVSSETVRSWMIADGLWVPHSRRKPRDNQTQSP
ncbi:helix-turn-helix domain-containing protein [Yersinia enterocolitica]